MADRQPPRPASRPGKVSLLRYARLFRRDILSAQPEKLYRARMAEFRTPFFRSFMINDPALVKTVLRDRPDEFPKSDRVREGLAPLLGNSVFVSNGETWKRQRRIIDPAFEGGRLHDVLPAMLAASAAAVARLDQQADGREVEIEAEASHTAADVIFRTLFSIPIDHEIAAQVFEEFRAYQRTQPLLNIAAFLPVPRWMPRFHRRATRQSAARIRSLITRLTEERMAAIHAGRAPDDLATKIMTTRDPVAGSTFDTAEMIDQVAIFFLAGHETSASALAWALYLLAAFPEAQARVATEAQEVLDRKYIGISDISALSFTRSVFREALRLYPPVPMMVRQAGCEQRFRDRDVPAGSQIVLSPWHLHRNPRLWKAPDAFDPDRWNTDDGRKCGREAYIPFSAGQRVCPGAGFAMTEGVLLIAMVARRFHIEPVAGKDPVPVAHLTVRSKGGIWLRLTPRV